jgi:hypothetical protein
LEYFTDIWELLCPFGTFCVDLVHFSGFGITYQEKSGNPGVSSWIIPGPTFKNGIVTLFSSRFK